jgi:hypothetical protein
MISEILPTLTRLKSSGSAGDGAPSLAAGASSPDPGICFLLGAAGLPQDSSLYVKALWFGQYVAPRPQEGGADLAKIDGAADFPAAVAAVTRAGIPVWAQLGITPQTALRHGVGYEAVLAPGARVPEGMKDELVAEAERLEQAGAARSAPAGVLEFLRSAGTC